MILMPRVILKASVYKELSNHISGTNFQHEIGGVLLGYRYLWIFYIVALTFPRNSKNMTKMTFVLNGEEHTEDMEKIRKGFLFPPKLIGVWHSHITQDISFSLQDREVNRLLVSRFGAVLSVIVTGQSGKKNIQLMPYYISKDNIEYICRTGTKI